MVWFDWFDDEEKRKRPVEAFRIEGDPTGQPTVQLDRPQPITTSESAPRNQIPADQSSFLQDQNKKASELKAKAAAFIKRRVPMHGTPSPGMSQVAAILRQIESADINTTKRLAELVKQATTRDGMSLDGDPEFEQLKKENNEFNKLVYKSPVDVSPVAVDPMKLDAARKALEDINVNAATASTEDERKSWEAQAKAQKALVDMYEKRQKGMKEEVEANAPPPAPPIDPEVERRKAEEQKAVDEKAARTAAFNGDDGTPGRDSIYEAFGGVSRMGGRKEFARQASQALKKIADVMPGDPMMKVPFYVGLPAIAEALGEEAMHRVLTPLANLQFQADQSAKRHRRTKQKLQDEGGELSDKLDAKIEQDRQLVAKLGQLDFMNTPLGIVSFILTSIVLGPKLTAFVFTRGSARGNIQNELRITRDDIKRIEEGISSNFQMQQRASERALDAETSFGMALGREQADTARMRESKLIEHHNRLAEIKAMNAGKAEDDPHKEVEKAFERQLRMYAIAENQMDDQNRIVADLQDKLTDPMLQPNMKKEIHAKLQAAIAKRNDLNLKRAEAEHRLNKLNTYLGEPTNSSRPGAPSGTGSK